MILAVSCESVAGNLPYFDLVEPISDILADGAWEISNHTLPVDPPYYKHMYRLVDIYWDMYACQSLLTLVNLLDSNGLNYVMLLKQDLKRDVLGYATGGATYDNAVLPGVLVSLSGLGWAKRVLIALDIDTDSRRSHEPCYRPSIGKRTD